MKKFIFSLSALAALFLAGSCQRENLEPVEQGGTVTYTVHVPQDIATKTDGDDVFTLHYEVYRKNAQNELTTLFYEGTKDFNSNGTVDVPLEFVKDQKFKVLFWAQKDAQQAYNIENLTSVSLKTLVANDTTAEVFAGSDDVDNCVSDQGADVVLVRPVAQLNIATTAAGLQLGTAPVTPTQSMVIVDGLYGTYNVATGTPGTKASRTYAGPTDDTPNVPGTDFKNGYKLMATNYLGFIPQDGDNVEVTFTIKTSEGDITHTVSNVPVKANYQTNILGNLISATADYQVTLEDWADAGKDMEVLADGIVENINGDYEISTAVGFAYAINKLFADGGTFYIHPGTYDFTGLVVVPKPTNTGAILNVKANEKPIVTRSTPGFEIIGLDVAYLVSEVTANSQAIFSNLVLPEDTKLVGTNNGVVGVSGCSNEDTNKPAELVGSGNGKVVNTVSMASVKDINDAIAQGLKLIELTADMSLTEIFTISSSVTLDGCGHKLTSTAARAINVSDAEDNGVTVTIKNLVIECSGERAINIIQNATNVTIDNVTATAANYTVNVAASAPSAEVNIENSTLNGLCTVNVSAESANVTVDNSTINCNDNNTTAGEVYSALSLNREAVGGKIIATNTVVNVAEGSDSHKGRNGAENGEVTINGSTEEVVVMVAAIIYPNNTNYHASASLDGAIDFAQGKNGVVTLIRNITVAEPIVIEEGQTVVLDLNGKTITGTMPKSVGAVVENNGTLTILNGTISSTAENGGSAILNNGTLTITDAIVYGAPSNTATGTASYAVNSQGAGSKLVVNNSTINGRGAVGATTGTKVEINDGVYHTPAVAWGHAVYADGEGTEVVINDGIFSEGYEYDPTYWGMYQIYSGNKAKVTVNGGTFMPWDCANGYDLCTAGEGTIEIYGGTFADNPASQNKKNYVAYGYKVVENADGTYTVQKMNPVAEADGVPYESLQEAVENATNGATITFLADIEQVDGVLITDKNLTVDLNDKTFTVTNGANTNNRNFKINGSSVVTIKNGTMVAAGDYSSGAYGTVRTEGTANVTLTDVKLYNYRGNGLNVKALSGTTVTISDTEVYSQYGGGIESAGGTIELTKVKVDQKGMYTAPYNSMAISVNGGGTVTVNSGTYSTECITAEEANNQGTSHGPWCAGVLNSGGTLIINGGTFSNDNFGENALATYARGLLLADTGANLQINGGTFNAVKAIVDVTNNLGDASRNPSVTLAGGDFSADPRVSGLYASHLISVVEGKDAVEDANGRWTLVKVQQNNEIWYVSDEMALVPTNPDAINATVVSNVWDKTTGKGVITFDDRLTTIGEKAFQRVTNATPSNWATSISLPEGVETIGNYAFAQCYSLTTITIPNTVTAIGEYAFQSCDAVTSVTIGSGVTEIGSGAFYNCYEIKEIVCKSNTPPALADKCVFSGVDKTAKVIVPAGSVDEYKADAFWSSFTNIVAE